MTTGRLAIVLSKDRLFIGIVKTECPGPSKYIRLEPAVESINWDKTPTPSNVLRSTPDDLQLLSQPIPEVLISGPYVLYYFDEGDQELLALWHKSLGLDQ